MTTLAELTERVDNTDRQLEKIFDQLANLDMNQNGLSKHVKSLRKDTNARFDKMDAKLDQLLAAHGIVESEGE